MAEHTDNPAVSHEESDVNVRAIFGFGVGLLVVGVTIYVLVWLLFLVLAAGARRVESPVYPLATGAGDRLPPEPRLQTAPRQDLIDLRAREASILGSYGWVDRNAGIVRIPIDEAVRLTLERGLPARQQKAAK